MEAFALIFIIGSTQPQLLSLPFAIAKARFLLLSVISSNSTNIRGISQTALAAICAYSWPGNIRELDHAVESAMLMADGAEIDLCHLPVSGHKGSDGPEKALPSIPTATRGGAPSETR